MSARQIQVTVPAGKGEPLEAWLHDQDYGSTTLLSGADEQGTDLVLVHLPLEHTQDCLEQLQEHLDSTEEKNGWRAVVVAVEAALPRLEDVEPEREERTPQEELYDEIWSGAGTHIDFLLMITLSGLIATVGLLLDDAATVIGAMVIAPMLGPLLGISLAVVLGDMRLLARAGYGAGLGLALILGVSTLTAGLIPGEILQASTQIAVRAEPNLFHLLVGLAAGAAGAISVGSAFVASLVGVAVAVALVPPLGVVGIGLANADWALVEGAGLLVGINLLTIIFAGIPVFRLKGARPGKWRKRQEAEVATRRAVVVAVVLLLLLALPLGRFSVTAWNENRIRGHALDVVQTTVPNVWSVTHIDVDARTDPVRVRMDLVVDETFTEDDYLAIGVALSERLDRPVEVELITAEAVRWPGGNPLDSEPE